MDHQTENLILHFVTEDDLAEVARTWPSDHHPLTEAEAQEAIAYMRGNYEIKVQRNHSLKNSSKYCQDLYRSQIQVLLCEFPKRSNVLTA